MLISVWLRYIVLVMVLCPISFSLTVWHSMATPHERRALEEIVALYRQDNPAVKVQLVYIPGNEADATKLISAVLGGSGPDVYCIDRFTIAQRAAQHLLEPLEPWLASCLPDSIDLARDFYPFAIREVIYNRQLYGLPFDTDVRVLYYNKAVMREIGLPADSAPSTLEELDEIAKRTTVKRGKKAIRYGFIPWQGQGWHYTWGLVFGGAFFDESQHHFCFATDSAILQSMRWQKKYAQEYGMQYVSAFLMTFGTNVQSFLTGRLAMLIEGNWLIQDFESFAPPGFEYGIAPIPHPRDGCKNSTWAGGQAFVMPRGVKERDAAVRFIVDICTRGQLLFAPQTKHLATFRPGNDLLIAQYPNMKFFVELLATAQCRPVLPVGALFWDKLTEARELIFYNKKSAQQALRDAQRLLQAELERADAH